MTCVRTGAMIYCSRGIPPLEAIPTAALAAHAAAVLRDEPEMSFQYAPLGRYLGDELLREQLASLHHVDCGSVFVSNGSLQVLDLVTRSLLQSIRRDVYVELPTYDRAIRMFERHGARIIGVPLEADGMDIDALQGLIRRRVPAFVYTIPDFQNPSGITMSAAKRLTLAALAAAHGFPIIEDTPYRRLRYHGAAPPTLFEIAEPGRVIAVTSLAKVLSPGLRIGYALATPEVVRHLAAEAEDTYLSPSPFCQRVAARAMAHGLVEANVERCVELFRPRWRSAVTVVQQRFGDRLMAVPEGGYFLGLTLRGSEAAVLAAARQAGVILTPGQAFYPRDQRDAGNVFVRMPFQALDPSDFRDAVDRLWAIAAAA